MIISFMHGFDRKELAVLRKLDKPWKIQDYVEKLPINFEERGDTFMSPRRVLREKKAHCLEGAVFAAAALWVNGSKPLVMTLSATTDDFSHVVAPFTVRGLWGAIGKTNHAVLRYRDPVYRSIRELAMSYFHEYFLDNGRKTLRRYSEPLDLRRIKDGQWTVAEEDLWYIDTALDEQKHYSLFPAKARRILRRADSIERQAGKLTQWTKRDRGMKY